MLFITIFASCSISMFKNDNPLRMWYDLPASKMPLLKSSQENSANSVNHDIWQQSTLPIGNGKIGANVFGEIKNEVLTFNEITLWEGGPSKNRPNYNGCNNINKGQNGTVFRRIQQLFSEGKDDEAKSLSESELLGDHDGTGQYIGFGEIHLDFELDEDKVTNYVRYLDLDQSIMYVQYEYQDTILTREYFVSNPDNVLVIHINSSNSNVPTFTISFDALCKSSKNVISQNSSIQITGELTDNQMIFSGRLMVTSPTATIESIENKKLKITGAKKDVYIYITAATDYKNDHPTYRTGETVTMVNDRVFQTVNKAVFKNFESLRKDHITDYQKYFLRVKLELDNEAIDCPLNDFLDEYKKGEGSIKQRRNLEILTFQFGRYLMISSSRENGPLPPNLQGLWNDLVENVIWQCDYHLNINLQMNFWPVYVTNMHELCMPLIDYVEKLRVPGHLTAQIYCGVSDENGFFANPVSTPFGRTAPGWEFLWGWSPSAILWILQNVFDYFLFTRDESILRERIYPLMREECFMYDTLLVQDRSKQRLVFSPAQSPEQGTAGHGNAYEQELIWQHYTNTIRAAELLKIDGDLVKKWNETLKKLNPIEIGLSGQIKEWYDETFLGSMGEKNHRHMSHLLALYPGDLINVETKEWLEASIVSLVDRGDLTTGWGMAQRINSWARTGDGNHAYDVFNLLICNRMFANLWDFHPPLIYQIDGNFGLTAGVAEMLLQSNLGYINVLPALPDNWKDGKVQGIVARGNVVVDISWNEKSVNEIVLRPKFSDQLIVKCKGVEKAEVRNKKGDVVEFSVVDQNKIAFEGVAGEVYSISQFKNKENLK